MLPWSPITRRNWKRAGKTTSADDPCGIALQGNVDGTFSPDAKGPTFGNMPVLMATLISGTQGLSQPDQVKPVKDDRCLSFVLTTDSDFTFFRLAATDKLLKATWTEPNGEESDADVDGQDDV